MKIRILSILLSFISLCLQAMPSEKTQKDSICEFLSGTWYKVLDCNGFNGDIQPVYMGDTLQIERVPGSDSLIFTRFKNGKIWYSNRMFVSHYDSEFDAWIFNSRIGSWIIFIDGQEFNYGLYNVADAGGEGYARKQLVTAVVNPTLSTDIRAFPNPTNGSLQLSEPIVGSVRILDASGRVLKRLNATQPSRTVDFTPFTDGMYFLQIETNGKQTTLKIQKR